MTIVSKDVFGSFNPPSKNRLYPKLFVLHRKIHELSRDLDDLQGLLKIQEKLITAIFIAEKEIRTAKKEGLDPRAWQYVRYNFLCLGDSLAFLYIDRFSLKQTFLNIHNADSKQSGGFISGKTGLDNELTFLKSAIDHGVPAVLCDLTNVIRYGDICLLGDSDPVPIEIKSSNKKDTRGKRQIKNLGALAEFLQKNHATNFRGVPGSTFRIGYSSSPRSFGHLLETAISEALSLGSSGFEVDGCLKFLIVAEDKPDYGFLSEGLGSARTLGNFVNEIKTNKIWGCYFPYALTLSNTDHYKKFVCGEISIISMLNIDAFEAKLASEGVELKVEASEDDILCHVNFPNLNGNLDKPAFIIGEHMMCRMWTDFLYPSWIVENTINSINNNTGLLSSARVEFCGGSEIK